MPGPSPWDSDLEVWVPKDSLTSPGIAKQVGRRPYFEANCLSKELSEGSKLERNLGPVSALDPKATLSGPSFKAP